VTAAAAARQRGFALLAVLLVLAMLGVIGAEFAYSMRLEASAVRAWKSGIAASYLVEAAVAQATRELAADAPFVVADEQDGSLVFFNRARQVLPRLPRQNVPLGPGQFSYRITDEEARLNLNTTAPDRLDRLLQQFGLEKEARDTIVDSLQDWRDPNEEHRLNGAESDDHYLKLAVPYRARNANLESVDEWLQIRGMTPAIFNGTDEQPPLRDAVTVRTSGQININTAGALVLRALGLADAEIGEIGQARREGPFTTLPGRFGGRGLATGTRTFRIEAEGIIEGQVWARATVILQKRSEAGTPTLAVLEWSTTQ
jgi:general secretion pathway protein K